MTPPRALLRLAGIGEKSERGRLIVAGLRAGEPEGFNALVEIAGQFQAVGRWSAKEWAALTPTERSACLVAQGEADARSARRIAALVGLAVRRPMQAEGMAAEFDGGALLDETQVQNALEEIEGIAAKRLLRSGA